MPTFTRRMTTKIQQKAATGTVSSGDHDREASVMMISPMMSTPTATKRRATSRSNTTRIDSGSPAVATTTAERILPSIVSPSPKKRIRNAATPTPTVTPTTLVQPPDDWEDIYDLVQELRRDRSAPCDHSGCEALPDAHADPRTVRFQVLLSLMLSSQTKDAVVGAAIRAMQRDNVLTVSAVSQMTTSVLDQYIAKVGFHNNKCKYIQQTVAVLLDKYEGDIPRTAAAMIADLPGVGPKMAYICESVAWGTQSGIGVDTHMHRIFNLLRWVQPPTKTPEQTRVQLEAWLPRQYWGEVNLLWVGFGQELQQEKPKLLRKALDCSRSADALRLIQRCGLDYVKVGRPLGLGEEIQKVIQGTVTTNNM